MKGKALKHAALCAAVAAVATPATAAEWSDTSIGWRYGETFAEPYNDEDISKHILNFTHASGYKYGTNFLNVDFLFSDSKDSPTTNGVPNRDESAQEVYVLYRHTLDLGKITGSSAFAYGPVRGTGVTLGFDFNTKSGDGYESKKRMWVFGPTFMLDVPGFLNVSLLMLWESNAPKGHPDRYHYDPHPMLNLAWGIPFSIGPVPLSFEGFANFIAYKGKDEFGGNTKPETNIDMQVMYDLSHAVGGPKNTFKVGLEYQYWRNKFGNDHTGPAGDGAFAKTPMIRAEYHF